MSDAGEQVGARVWKLLQQALRVPGRDARVLEAVAKRHGNGDLSDVEAPGRDEAEVVVDHAVGPPAEGSGEHRGVAVESLLGELRDGLGRQHRGYADAHELLGETSRRR